MFDPGVFGRFILAASVVFVFYVLFFGVPVYCILKYKDLVAFVTLLAACPGTLIASVT